ncbi:replication stress response regulator SDE2 [Megalops cyprinoides]|uniref:replication stress response regulator SDE2 n=1 Tax=Megalops cyprinoides TaxID=118141 RepID=UPI001864E263|nr:replication stress response regulator SDE2 [Megalops cyprinoides]
MEVLVTDLSFRLCHVCLSSGASVGDLAHVLSQERGIPTTEFYVKNNGRLLGNNERLQEGVWYRMEPRLCGGKGGFGSMLRALGAQIEKTTNREACRDLSGRRLRDVNHEKEMAEWLKKQADREAEKEQRRMERLQRKLAEPKHYFSDPEYEKQCHEMSERLEESIKRGMQASSSGVAGATRKRSSPYEVESGKRKCDWLDVINGISSSEDDSDASDGEASATSSSAAHPTRSSAAQSCVPQRAAEATGIPSTNSSGASTGSSSPQSSPGEPHKEEAEGEAAVVAQEVEAAVEREAESAAVAQEEAAAPGSSEGFHTQQSTPSDRSPEETSQQEVAATQPADDSPLDLQAVSSAAELEALGLERLKMELVGLGMKCGGTLQERAARLFSVRGLSKDEIPSALLAKPTKGKKK